MAKHKSDPIVTTARRKPIVIRICKLRAAFRRKKLTKSNACHTMIMTVPAEISRMAGLQLGDTMLVEGYADGFYVRKGGDLMSAEDKDL